MFGPMVGLHVGCLPEVTGGAVDGDVGEASLPRGGLHRETVGLRDKVVSLPHGSCCPERAACSYVVVIVFQVIFVVDVDRDVVPMLATLLRSVEKLLWVSSWRCWKGG